MLLLLLLLDQAGMALRGGGSCPQGRGPGQQPVDPSCPPLPTQSSRSQGGTLGMWPKPYRTKKRQTMPNSIHQWKCGKDAANYSLAAATNTPLLQSGGWAAGWRLGLEVAVGRSLHVKRTTQAHRLSVHAATRTYACCLARLPLPTGGADRSLPTAPCSHPAPHLPACSRVAAQVRGGCVHLQMVSRRWVLQLNF